MKKQNKSKKIPRIIILAALVLITFIFAATPGFPNHIGRAAFFYLIPLIICIGVFESVAVSTWLGLFAGILWDCISAEIPGFHAIMLMCFGCISSLIMSNYLRKKLVSALIVGGSGIILYVFFYWIFFLWLKGVPSASKVLFDVYLPSILITAVTLPVFYFIAGFIHRKLRD